VLGGGVAGVSPAEGVAENGAPFVARGRLSPLEREGRHGRRRAERNQNLMRHYDTALGTLFIVHEVQK
jgi:hypothetical protein